jgi:precorrin-6B methylase 2
MKKHEHAGFGRRSFSDPDAVLIKAGLQQGNAVLLDVGTGTGYLALAAAAIMGAGSKIYALDSHEGSITSLVLC